MNTKRTTLSILLTLALAACGGGGGEEVLIRTDGGSVTPDGHVASLDGAPTATAAPTTTDQTGVTSGFNGTPIEWQQPADTTSPAPAPAPVTQQVAPEPTPSPAPAPAAVAPAPASPPAYNETQYRIKGVIEGEISKVTTYTLDPVNQMPGWIAHFEPRENPDRPWEWRQEMRRIAIEDGRRFGWPRINADVYVDSGAARVRMACRINDVAPDQDGRVLYRWAWIENNKIFMQVIPAGSSTAEVPTETSLTPEYQVFRNSDGIVISTFERTLNRNAFDPNQWDLTQENITPGGTTLITWSFDSSGAMVSYRFTSWRSGEQCSRDQ